MSKIAWIEDDHDEIPSLVRLLELDEHNILRYRTCQEVEEDLEEICGCDAVILDIILPPATDDLYQGVSVLRKLREECKYSGPVVICSVVRNPDVLKAVRELGVSDILHKPVRPSKLYDAMTKALAEGGPEISQ
jgi:DNA-binding response OmpR family regulator